MKTALCDRLGIDYPIFSVGFGAAATAELAAAVSNAGACGVLGTAGLSPNWIRRELQRLQKLTSRPFGVNVILAIRREGVIEACLDARPPLLVLFWGDATPWIDEAHRRGVKVFLQVGSVDEARAASAAGVDGIIAQGFEAGGHVKGRTSLAALLPAVVEAVRPVPVVAAGGIANGAGIVAALSLGAQGVSLGTRFVASEEANVPRAYKERIVAAAADETVYSKLFDIGWPNAPHRTLKNKIVEEWEAAGRPPAGKRPGEGTAIGKVVRGETTIDVPKYGAAMLTADFKGDPDYAPLWAGESCGLVHDIKPAAEIVRDLVREAQDAMSALNAKS